MNNLTRSLVAGLLTVLLLSSAWAASDSPSSPTPSLASLKAAVESPDAAVRHRLMAQFGDTRAKSLALVDAITARLNQRFLGVSEGLGSPVPPEKATLLAQCAFASQALATQVHGSDEGWAHSVAGFEQDPPATSPSEAVAWRWVAVGSLSEALTATDRARAALVDMDAHCGG